MSVKRLAVALCAAAMATGTGTAYAQDATGSVGTVQVAEPATTADVAVSPPTTADVNDGVATDPVVSVDVATAPSGGPQTADDSTGTVQVGGGGAQRAGNSVGTVQASVPNTRAGGRVTAPTTADLNDGVTTDPRVALAAAASPAPGGSQRADNSVGTVQAGGGSQTAADSVGTVQVAYPSIGLAALLGLPTSLDLNDGLATDPSVLLALLLMPGGGPQTADNSTGTAQIGGGGRQTATDSTGTVQVAVPSVEAAVAGSDPAVDAGVVTTPSGGSQTVDNSTGTVQIGGGGASAESTPTGVGDGPSTAGTTAAGAATPAAGVLPAAAAPQVRTPAAAPKREAAARKGNVNPREFTAVARAAQLPFTGAALLPALLLGLALLGLGLATRRRCVPLT